MKTFYNSSAGALRGCSQFHNFPSSRTLLSCFYYFAALTLMNFLFLHLQHFEFEKIFLVIKKEFIAQKLQQPRVEKCHQQL